VWLKDTPRGDWEFVDSVDAVDEVDDFLVRSALLRAGLQREERSFILRTGDFPPRLQVVSSPAGTRELHSWQDGRSGRVFSALRAAARGPTA
jgi:hypothetical protein